jgi:hypothetical protein
MQAANDGYFASVRTIISWLVHGRCRSLLAPSECVMALRNYVSDGEKIFGPFTAADIMH